ncbi:hypothetical protein ACFE04_003494 [Oxalis oulophora]
MGSRKFFQTKPNYVFPNNSTDDDDDHNNNTFEFDEADMFNPSSNGSKSVMVNKKTNYNSCLSKLINSSSSFNKKININDHGNRTASSSLPVNVPDWSKILKKEDHHIKVTSDAIDQGFDDDDDDDDVDDDQNKWVPPHEYLAQRRGASFSVHEGRGRTLKGSDLSRVRNAIFEKMGFED